MTTIDSGSNSFVKRSKSKQHEDTPMHRNKFDSENRRLKEEISKFKRKEQFGGDTDSSNSPTKRTNVPNSTTNALSNDGFNQNSLNNVNSYRTALQESNKEDLQNALKKSESLQFQLRDERNQNRELILQIQSLEDALKKLNTEYNSLSFKFAKLNSESEMFEKIIYDLKHNLQINKTKFEELIKVNQELKDKHFEKENFINSHNKDMKTVLKRNQFLNNRVEDLEKALIAFKQDNDIKESRLKALRTMNMKLEQRSSTIIKKWEQMQLLEKKTEETYMNYLKQIEYVDELNKKITNYNKENEDLKKSEVSLKKEYSILKDDNKDLRKQVADLKSVNDELAKKLEVYDSKFKSTLYASKIAAEKQKTNPSLDIPGIPYSNNLKNTYSQNSNIEEESSQNNHNNTTLNNNNNINNTTNSASITNNFSNTNSNILNNKFMHKASSNNTNFNSNLNFSNNIINSKTVSVLYH